MNLLQVLKTSDNYNISAVHTIADKYSVVLWLHGITVNKNEHLDFFKEGADFLYSKGIDSLRIDFRGHGESDGISKEFSIVGQLIDVKAAIKYIKNYYSNKKTDIYIVGCSFGAPPAIYTAIEYPDLVRGVVLISPVLSYKKTFLKPETEWARSIFNSKTIFELENGNELFFDEGFSISIRLVEEMKLIKPELDIKNISQNIIIIHGDSDSMVPYNVSKEIADSVPNIKLYTIANMDHGFMDKLDEDGTNIKSIENKKYIYKLIKDYCS